MNESAVIVDLGLGNLGSLSNMIEHIGYDAIVSDDLSEVRRARRIILSGVGAFDTGMERLLASGLVDAIAERAKAGEATVLGVCLGMQMLLDSSQEGERPGLGWIPGQVRRLQSRDNSVRVPHMGWNLVRPAGPSQLLDGLDADARFYFVHSYAAHTDDPSHTVGITHHGDEFASVVCDGSNVYGVQFHPEKSHRFGMTVLENFFDIAPC